MLSEGVTLFLLMVNVGNSNDHPRGTPHRCFVVVVAVGWSKSGDVLRICRNLSLKGVVFFSFFDSDLFGGCMEYLPTFSLEL